MAQTPAVQRIAQRLEQGGVLSCTGLCRGAQPFFAALLRHLFPRRPLVVVTEGLKSQESFHQDVSTWLHAVSRTLPETGVAAGGVLFYPAWEVLPHEGKLPHADVISERLETLVALSWVGVEPAPDDSPQPMVIANVTALLQRTFPAQTLCERMRLVRRGDLLDPLDLIEWLEDQGYEPEAQVNHKGEIALRGGILDIFPLTSPWPVRLEFFGNELESLRYFDPITQVSREPVERATLAPAGEMGILKKLVQQRDAGRRPPCLATLPDHLPRETLWLLCEPEALEQQTASCAELVPADDPFFVSWETFLTTLAERGMTRLEVTEGAADVFECAELACTLHESSSLASPVQSRGSVPVPESPSPSPLPSPLGRGNSSGPPVQVRRRVPSSPHSGPSQNHPEDNPAASARHPIGEGFSLSPRERAGVRGNQACEDHEGSDRLNACQEGATLLPSPPSILNFSSLDAFRPILERAPEPPVAEAQRREFFAQLHRWLRQGYDVHVFCNNDGERQRFGEIWDEYGFTVYSPKSKIPGPTSDAENGPWALDLGLWTHLGSLGRGFLCEEARLVVVTDAEIFGRYKVQRPRRLKSPHAQTSRSLLEIDFGELEEGDYVVHLQHGIGRYLGLQVLPPTRQHRGSAADPASLLPGTGQECLVIEYAPRDPDQPAPRLYVPVTEAHLVSKYIGAGKARPPLNTLGGTRWAKTKEQAEQAVRDLAAELLSIQAARESLPGHAFASDTPWQREFESAFLYEETPDQIRAIVETKADLERQKPMDRLICGDVGYGKTEVAIRAAFKAVMGGKQVAMLVPTTILAQQHFNTFRERMADYPIRIELLSRFRTRRQQQRVLRELASGAVDIVIGTHRLVQEDIAFKDVGLVVIDEEQRFGVLHKEKFKRLRQLVDVLTLSATPIPRTLYLALTGARDMSTIETPPQDRLPVETIVTQYDERVIRDAIRRELNRGGQVFYLHNRVFDIDAVAARLKALVPKARLVVGHGQMPDDDLEEVMTRFVNGEADVLLSTTIIESGIDIPNANTIIIDRADRFGLSDLYQLRGRVGRYKHQAYAYLLIPRHAGLLSDARKRISAIRQYSALGSGFRIAMRDLEIRGAGNLLGPQQSGHITAVGFELYCQLLKQSIGALKGENVKPRLAVLVHLDFLALNPGEEAEVRGRRSEVGGQRSEVSKRRLEPEPEVNVPRETPVYVGSGDEVDSAFRAPHSELKKAAAYIPVNYINDARQRVEIYRKLAEVVDEASLERLKGELRDRFGPLPAAVDLLLRVATLKIVADERGITAVETEEDKLKLTRHNDFIMIDGKFLRLTRTTAKARLAEIVRILGAL